MTIGEAFKKAGYPVPSLSWLVYFPQPGLSTKEWFYLDHNDQSGECLYWFPSAPEGWRPCKWDFNPDEVELLRGQVYESICIWELPAMPWKHCLPQCVAQVVEG